MTTYTITDIDYKAGVATLTCDVDNSEQTVHNVPTDTLDAVVSFLDVYVANYASEYVPPNTPTAGPLADAVGAARTIDPAQVLKDNAAVADTPSDVPQN